MPYADPVQQREYSARYQRDRKLSTKAYRENPTRRAKQLARERFNRRGVSQEQYDAMVDSQGGVCLLCAQPETDLTNLGYLKSLAVDHDWETGEIRGLLCRTCNVLAGRTGPLPDRAEVMPA